MARLSIGVDVHLHHAVTDGLVDLGQARAGAAVETEVEGALPPVPRAYRILDLAQDTGRSWT